MQRAVLRRALGVLAALTAGAIPLMGPAQAVPQTAGTTPARSEAAAPPHRAAAQPRGDEPLVIAHRGASEYRPEHTLAAYRLAIEMGADYIEPDLVSTKDQVLVARHENRLADTTDVAEHPEFADRRTTKVIDGQSVTDWFTEDFTLAELRTLRAEERLPALRPDNTVFDELYRIPTFEEVLRLARDAGVGVYPETKHPTYFDSIGLSLEEPLVALLDEYGYDTRRDKAFIQSFETANLRELDDMTNLRLVQLIGGSGKPYDFVVADDPRTYDDLATPEGLRWISRYADGIGPDRVRIIPVRDDGSLGEPTTLVRDAHRRALVVHPYTFREENAELPTDFQRGNPDAPGYAGATGDIPGMLELFYGQGIDGLFCDSPDVCVSVREEAAAPRG